MKKYALLLILAVCSLKVMAYDPTQQPLDELVIIDGIISFLDEGQPLLNVDGYIIGLDMDTTMWPGGLKEGDKVRVQGVFKKEKRGRLEVSGIEILPVPLRDSQSNNVTTITPKAEKPRESPPATTPLEDAAAAASNSAISSSGNDEQATE